MIRRFAFLYILLTAFFAGTCSKAKNNRGSFDPWPYLGLQRDYSDCEGYLERAIEDLIRVKRNGAPLAEAILPEDLKDLVDFENLEAVVQRALREESKEHFKQLLFVFGDAVAQTGMMLFSANVLIVAAKVTGFQRYSLFVISVLTMLTSYGEAYEFSKKLLTILSGDSFENQNEIIELVHILYKEHSKQVRK